MVGRHPSARDEHATVQAAFNRWAANTGWNLYDRPATSLRGCLSDS